MNTGVVKIHGKEYQTVALRVQKFRDAHPGWSLTSEVLFRDSDCVVMKSIIADETGRVLATGHAEEYRKASQINGTSALENAETSAHGRSLAALGIGGTEFASANEVQNAIHQQSNPETHIQKIEGSQNVSELHNNWTTAYKALRNLPDALALVEKVKDKRKSELAA